MTSGMETVWPAAGVLVRSGDLELRYLDDELALRLALLAADGVHAPDFMPFTNPWTRGTPDEVARSVLQYQWKLRSTFGPEAWALELAVLRDGEVLGIQGMYTEKFTLTRSGETGSWLGLRYQGQGVGTRMRLAVLHLLFEGLDAQRATTSAFADNGPSNAVTRRLGYRENGTDTAVREDAPVVSRRYVLERADWDARPPELRPPVELEGVGPLRAFLRLDGADGSGSAHTPSTTADD
ncbi:GNAT family N-acetyltransferase [Cellulomonas sp. DKR-3]|uniref:GNAT family N-acetyltransferase n=1 Tax=Cellulomonas fulva TaxID=2835530 RepID=A0ABS5TWI8_9CELL|nr:GNAT family protein [Cellulomonas fulva]MBT0993471.1 GNAT family N-acetyltransferase [Cellulomonas fulva]